MKTYKFAFKRVFKKGEHSLTRIISLVAGLAFGIILLSEVLYYKSFDSFYPDASHIYVIQENYKYNSDNNEWDSNSTVSGAIAPAMKKEIPGIEDATRLNSIGSSVFYAENNKKSYKGKFVLADENIFDILPRPMIKGNVKETLSKPMYCIISSKMAEELGEDIIGKTIELRDNPGKFLTVGGIFESLPENTYFKYDILISISSTAEFTWDGRDNWVGNDRYYSCVKIQKGIDPESLSSAIRKMQEKYQHIEKIEAENGVMLKYTFKNIQELYANDVKNMTLILAIIAFSVLFISMMNYILLTLSALIKRAKTSAIYKACGAQTSNLLKMIFSESSILFLISIIGAFIAIILFAPLVEHRTGHKMSSTLNPTVIFPILTLLVIIMGIISFLPGYFFSKIPVATAFRTYKQKKNKWKLGLLALQFAGASFILAILTVVSLQYNQMKTANHGYRAKQVYYASTSGLNSQKLSTIINQLNTMPEVKTVAMGSCIPVNGADGNNIYSQDGKKELFNIADLYCVDENYLSLLEIPIHEGEDFNLESASLNDVLISKKCAELLKMTPDWKEGVVGESVLITGHDNKPGTIKGVYDDFVIRSIADPDNRPSAVFFASSDDFIKQKIKYPDYDFYIMVKINEKNEAGILPKLEAVFNLANSHDDTKIYSLETEQLKSYEATNGFRLGMVAGNIIILVITLMGLLGYTSNEATRRSKELAIRKINGANFLQVITIFLKDILLVALPALLLGIIPAWLTANQWMQNFATKITLHWYLFSYCSLFILLLITVITIINYTRMINQNPVEALRYE